MIRRHATWLQPQILALVAALACVLSSLVATPASATTPGVNGRIAFKRYLDADRSTGAILTVQPNGARARQITFPDPGTVDDQPDWSPDGTLVAFRRCAPDTVCAIYTVRPDGTHLHRLSAPCTASAPDIETTCADESEVAFLPDGHRVLFTRSTGRVRDFPNDDSYIEHSDIVVRDLSGRSTRVLLRSAPFAGDNIQMVSSTDGAQIAFLRHNSPLTAPADGIAIFVMRSDGTHLRQLTPWSLRAGDHADWSPDGRWILFRSPDNNDFLDAQLYVIHPSGAGLRQITHVSAGAQLLSASFSPNGRRIVFSQTGTADQPDIFTVRVDGRALRQVTSTDLWDSAPDWGPRPCPSGRAR